MIAVFGVSRSGWGYYLSLHEWRLALSDGDDWSSLACCYWLLMSTRMTADLVCDALSMALWRRGFPRGVIVHSDRGSQYCSKAYREIIDKHQLKQSMSRKGNCWDNTCVESFFHSLKVKAIQYEPLMNRAQMRQPYSNTLRLITTEREGTVLLAISALSNMKN